MKRLFYIVWSWFTKRDKDLFWLDRADEDAKNRAWCLRKFLSIGVHFEN